MSERNEVIRLSNESRRVPRWTVTCFYCVEPDGIILDVTHSIMELDELTHLVEFGPDWHALDRIEIRMERDGIPATMVPVTEI